MTDELRIPLPWTSPPLHMNQRFHWAKKARESRLIRDTVAWNAQGQTVTPPVEVDLVWVVSDRRRRDLDNPAPTRKAAIDGLVDAGVLPDDSSQIVVGGGTRIEFGMPRRMYLHVQHVPEAPVTLSDRRM